MTTRIASSTAAATPGRDSRSWKCRTGNRSKPSGVGYADHDGVSLLGDLYLPAGAGRHPALVAVHGGGWQAGARSSFQHWGPGSPSADTVRDQLPAGEEGRGVPAGGSRRARRGAVRARRRRAVRIDPERIGLFGASAGAHLSALAALGGASPIFGCLPRSPCHRRHRGEGAGRRLRRIRSGRDVAAL